MEAVYVPKERKAGKDLRELAAKYITNGRYNLMKSTVVAEEYKQRREEQRVKRVRAGIAATMFYTNLLSTIKTKIRY